MVPIGGVLRTWRAREVTAVLAATVTLLRVELALRRHPLPPVAARLGVPVTETTAAAREPFTGRLTPRERRALRGVDRVLRHWRWGDTCLRRSLAVGHVLRRRRPLLRIGVAKKGGVVSAHAWLEIDGRSLDPDSAPYAVLDLGPGRVA